MTIRCRTLVLMAALLISACTGLPDGIKPVGEVDAERYLGTWYEIARLDHSFERGLSNVTAQYRRQEDGSLKVINRGYATAEQRWEEAEGRAVFMDDPPGGHLKVSFFGPFYASYVIFRLDHEAYEYAYVTGYNRDYLWLLARSPVVSDSRRQHFIDTAQELGFTTDELIFVNQDRSSQNGR